MFGFVAGDGSLYHPPAQHLIPTKLNSCTGYTGDSSLL